MIKYYCDKCEIERESSICPECNSRTRVSSKIYWCKNCNVPIYNDTCSLCGEKGTYLTTDLRPVFPEERLLLEVLIDEPFKFKNSSVWNGVGNRYIVDGKKIKVSIKNLMEKNKDRIDEIIKILDEYKAENNYDYFTNNIKTFIKANKSRYNFIFSEATEYINKVSEGYHDDEMFVSFSGGKDSIVVSDLVIRALSKPEMIHIFGDTTLEFPLTLEFVKRFKKNNRKTPMITAKNRDKSFIEMCDIVGPPSRVMSWCCYAFKTSAITRKISGLFKDKKKVLTFYGIRRSESSSRSKYDQESDSPKITKQKMVSPIIDWFDFDVWLYILTSKIDFNDAYRLGYARVGCWCCPNNSNWSWFLSSVYMPQKQSDWRQYLINFAKKIGKPDPEVYVDEGYWRARQGGNGVELSKNITVAYKPCAVEDNTFNYELNRPITEQLYELFKPFGWLNKQMGNARLGEVYVLNKNNQPLLRLQGRIGSNLLKVSIINKNLARSKGIREAKLKVECQLTKYQMCIGCLACQGVCKHDAIKISDNSKVNSIGGNVNTSEVIENVVYKIDNDKCVRCGDCINHFTAGCYMRKVVMTRRGVQ